MAHIAGRTFVSIDRLFSIDETGSGLIASPPFRGITAPVPVGHLSDSDFRVYVGTTDGNIALFHGDGPGAPQLFHVTDRPVLWSLYHAAGVVYLGTGQFGASPPFGLFALDDQTLALKWLLSSEGPVAFPVGVAYDGNTPKPARVMSTM